MSKKSEIKEQLDTNLTKIDQSFELRVNLSKNIDSVFTVKVPLELTEKQKTIVEKELVVGTKLWNFAIDYILKGFGPYSKKGRIFPYKSTAKNYLGNEIKQAYFLKFHKDTVDFSKLSKDIYNLRKFQEENRVEKMKPKLKRYVKRQKRKIKKLKYRKDIEAKLIDESTKKIKQTFAKKAPYVSIWKTNIAGISSQTADALLSTLFTAFEKYFKEQYRMEANRELARQNNRKWILKEDSLAEKEKIALLVKRRAKYRPNKLPEGELKKTTFVKTPKIKDRKTLNLPIFKEVLLKKSIKKHMDNGKIAVVAIKKKSKNRFVAHLTFRRTVTRAPYIDESQAVGLDWGMKGYEPYITSYGEKIIIPEKDVKSFEELDEKIKKVQTLRDVKKLKKYEKRYAKLHAKLKNKKLELRRKLANQIVKQNDLIAIEELNSFSMRRKGQGKAISKGFNKKLSLLAPGEMQENLLTAANRYGKTLIKVNSYGTSQVDFGTNKKVKRSLEEREWYSEELQRVVHRDVNAAQNILQWAMSPEKHIAYRLKDSKEKSETLQRIIRNPKTFSANSLITTN